MSLESETGQGNLLFHGAPGDHRGPRLVARTLFREMQRSGFTHRQVLAVADELLGCLCAAARSREATASPVRSRAPDAAGS